MPGLLLTVALGASVAAAQGAAGFAGTFAATVPNGEAVVTLVVAERVTGMLTGPGTELELVGDLDPSDGAVRGVATAGGESVRFAATLAGDLLTFVLFELDAEGRANMDTAVTLEFRRVHDQVGGAPSRSPAGLPIKPAPATATAVAVLTPDLVGAVHDAVEDALSLPEALMELAIDAALEAGRLGQTGIALVGTLSQREDGTLRFARDAGDALYVHLLDGTSLAIAFLAGPQGTLDASGDAFVEDPHVLDIRVVGHRIDGPLDLRVTSLPLAPDGTQDVRMSGRFARGSAAWEVEAGLERFERYVVDGIVDGEIRVQGQLALSSADLGATVTSTRAYRYRIVNVVENVDHAFDTEIVLAADRVRLSGRVFVAFREALPIDRDQWVVQGALTRGGAPLGGFRAVDGTSALQVVLDLDGASLPLFTFPY